MRKRKVKVPHPITGKPFEVELETITLPSGKSMTGYRFGGAVVEYKEPRKHSAYFESAEQEERLRAELVALWGTFAKAFLTKLGPTPPEDHPVLMSRMQWLEMQCDYLLERHLEALRVISRLRDALDAARAGGKRGGRPSIKPPGTDDLIRDMVTKNNKLRGTRKHKSARALDEAIARALNKLLTNCKTPLTGANYITRLQARDWRLALAKQSRVQVPAK